MIALPLATEGTMQENSNETEGQLPTETSNENTRREAIAKMGLYAAYTTPIMLAMMTAAKAQVASGIIIIKKT